MPFTLAVLLVLPAGAYTAKDKEEERRDLARFLVRQYILQGNMAAAHQFAAMHAMHANYHAQLVRSGYFTPSPLPPDWWRNRPKVEEIRVVKDNVPFSFRELPGERELRMARLWASVDIARAKELYRQSLVRSGNVGPVAAQARKELEALD